MKKRIIETHADLLQCAPVLNEAPAKDARLGIPMMVDPRRAFAEAGFEFSDDIAGHVRHRLRELEMTCDDHRLSDRIRRGEAGLPWVKGARFKPTW